VNFTDGKDGMDRRRVAVFSSFKAIGPHVGVVFSSSSDLYSPLLTDR
jgi:hypothetical protein